MASPRGRDYAELRERGRITQTERAAERYAALDKENYSKEKFQGTEFVCQLVEFAHIKSGDIIMKLRLPYMYRHQGSSLQDAYGVMLQCTLEPWSQATEAAKLDMADEFEETG